VHSEPVQARKPEIANSRPTTFGRLVTNCGKDCVSELAAAAFVYRWALADE